MINDVALRKTLSMFIIKKRANVCFLTHWGWDERPCDNTRPVLTNLTGGQL